MSIYKYNVNKLFINNYFRFVSTIVPPSSLGVAKISYIQNLTLRTDTLYKFKKMFYNKGVYLLSVAIMGIISLVGNITTVYLDGRLALIHFFSLWLYFIIFPVITQRFTYTYRLVLV